jgi:transposase
LDPLSLLEAPVPLAVEDVKLTPSLVRLIVASTGSPAACPVCGVLSRRVHSRYERHLDDLPWGALAVRLTLRVRRFFCSERACERRVFTERLPGWVASWARRTLIAAIK